MEGSCPCAPHDDPFLDGAAVLLLSAPSGVDAGPDVWGDSCDAFADVGV